MQRVSKQFKDGKYFRAKANLTPSKAKEAKSLLNGIHHVRIVEERGRKSVYIMDRKEKNTY